MRVLLIGLGRMGQRYVNVLKRIAQDQLSLTTVDPQNQLAGPTEHFSELRQVPDSAKFDLAIDAHPNQDRFEVLNQLLVRQVPKIVVEKPHAASIQESLKMLKLAEKNSRTSRIMLPFYRFYAEAYQEDTLKQLEAGLLKSIHITAGGIGFGCNGVHLIDFACRLFKTDPTSVYGQIQENSIPSPRGAQFKDHGGVMVATFPNGSLTLTIHPESSMGINTTLQFEHGKIQICEQMKPFWLWWRRNPENLSLPIYRTNLEQELTPPMPYNFELEACIETGLKAFLAGQAHPTLADGHRTLKAIALALTSSKQQRLVKWSEDSEITEQKFQFT